MQTPDYLPTARGFHNYLGYVSGKNFYWSKNSPDYQEITDFMYADSNCYNLYNGSDRGTYSTTIYKDMAVKTIKQHDYEKGKYSFPVKIMYLCLYVATAPPSLKWP